MDLEEGRLK